MATTGSDTEQLDDHALMALRANALFIYDARGRMISSNEPREDARRPAPRCFLGISSAGYVLRCGAALPDDLVRQLDAALLVQSPSADLRLPQPVAEAVREALELHAPVSAANSGPAYRFPETIVQPRNVVRLTMENRDLARETFPWLYREIDDWQPCFAIVDGGEAVSTCFSSRIRATVEAGVDTLPDFRGRGYASDVTAAWGAAVRASGRIPVYSTEWENIASQGVARRLGLILCGADASWV